MIDDYYMHTYGYPRNYSQLTDKEAVRICHMIERRFKDTPEPSPDQIVNNPTGYEAAKYIREFAGKQWQLLHPDFLNANHASVSFFSPEAMRYYIPAYMILDLMGNSNTGTPLFTLINFGDGAGKTINRLGNKILSEQQKKQIDSQMRDSQLNCLSKFSDNERHCIIAYLNYKMTLDPYEKEDIQNALDCFWLKE